MARRFTGPKLVVATHNRGKAGELRSLLGPLGVEIVSAGDLGLPAPEETGTTFRENATIKALAASRASGLPALADDSGISVAALGDRPGRQIDTGHQTRSRFRRRRVEPARIMR